MVYYEYRAFCGNISVNFFQKSINYDIAEQLLQRHIQNILCKTRAVYRLGLLGETAISHEPPCMK